MSDIPESEISRLRRLVGETDAESSYTDEMLTEYIEQEGGSVYWAAADICREKAASSAGLFDFSADGGSYQRGEISAKWLKMADTYSALGGKKNGGTIRLVKWPAEPKRRNVLEDGTELDA